MIGIYQIKNQINKKTYVGKSKNIPMRFIRHRSLLNTGNHFNRHLQCSYNKYGKDVFLFEVLEYCESVDLATAEQRWIDSYDPKKVYNKVKFVEDLVNVRNPFFGKSHTEETRKIMSDLKKGMYLGIENPNFGNRWTEDQKERMRGNKNCNAKLDERKVLEIKQLISNGLLYKDIALRFGVTRTVITRIGNGTRWAHVKKEGE
jgi:group I intron endonuclease